MRSPAQQLARIVDYTPTMAGELLRGAPHDVLC